MHRVRFLFTVAVSLLVAACGLSNEHIREFGEKMVTLIRDVRMRPALHNTADGCAVDLAPTNPNVQRMRVIMTYRALDADARQLPGLRVAGVVPGSETMVLHGESTPGLACVEIARIELLEARFTVEGLP